MAENGDKGIILIDAEGQPAFMPIGEGVAATCGCGGPMTLTIAGLVAGEKWPRTGADETFNKTTLGAQFGNGVHKVCASRFTNVIGNYTLWKTNQWWIPGYTGTTSKTVKGGGVGWRKWQGYTGGWNGIGGALALNTSYQYRNLFTRSWYVAYYPTYTSYWKTNSTTWSRTIIGVGHKMKWIYNTPTATPTTTSNVTAGGGAAQRAVNGSVTLSTVNGATPLAYLNTLPGGGLRASPTSFPAMQQTHIITSNFGGTPHNVAVTWQIAASDVSKWQSWGKSKASKFSWYTKWSTFQTGYNPWYYPYKSNKIQYGYRFYYSCEDNLA